MWLDPGSNPRPYYQSDVHPTDLAGPTKYVIRMLFTQSSPPLGRRVDMTGTVDVLSEASTCVIYGIGRVQIYRVHCII